MIDMHVFISVGYNKLLKSKPCAKLIHSVFNDKFRKGQAKFNYIDLCTCILYSVPRCLRFTFCFNYLIFVNTSGFKRFKRCSFKGMKKFQNVS